MAASLVTGQHAYTARGPGAGASITVTLPNNPTPGNLVVVAGLWVDFVASSASVTSIQDGNGNAYTQAPNSPETTNGAACGAVYLFYLRVAPANANKAITLTWGASGDFTTLWAVEFTATSLPFIFGTGAQKGSGTGTTINLPTVTHTGNNELLIGYATSSDFISACNSPWTAAETIPVTNGDCLAYILDRSTDAALNFTNNSSTPWGGIGMSFQMTPAGTTITPPVGSLTLAGQAPTAVITTPTIAITPGVGALVITGQAPTRLTTLSALPGLGALTLAGQVPTVFESAQQVIVPGVGSLTLTGSPPTAVSTANQFASLGLGTLTLAGFAPSVAQGTVTRVMGLGALTLQGFAPGTAFLGPDTGVLTLLGFAPTPVISTSTATITPGSGALALAGFAPSLAFGTVTRAMGLGALVLAGAAPTVTLGTVALSPDVGLLTVLGFAPSITAGQLVTTGLGTLTIAGQSPSVVRDVITAMGLGSLSLSGFAPTAQVLGPFVPDTGTLTLTGNRPFVNNSEHPSGGTGSDGRDLFRYRYPR